MRMAVSLEDGLGLDGDRCMRDTPTPFKYKALFSGDFTMTTDTLSFYFVVVVELLNWVLLGNLLYKRPVDSLDLGQV